MNFTAALDSVLSQHLEAATVFEGASNTIQNELLDIMHKTMHWKIQIIEKLWSFCEMSQGNAETLSSNLLKMFS